MRRGPALALSTLALLTFAGCKTRLYQSESPSVEAGLCSDPLVTTVGVGPPVSWVGSGDLDGDGKADLVGAGNGVSIVYGIGDGTFSRSTDVIRTQKDYYAAVADFDGDGLADVVVGEPSQPLEFVAGRANRVPAPGVIASAVIPAPSWIAPGDLDGDGVNDLAAVTLGAAGQGFVEPLLGRRDGRFIEEPARRVKAPGTILPFVTMGDVNGDHLLDLAVTTSLGVLLVVNEGGGNFELGATVPLPIAPAAIALADFNEDGNLDVAAIATQPDGDNVFVALGNGNDTFADPSSLRASHDPVAIVALDFNRDGHLDLAVANSGTDHSVSLLYGFGDGTFEAALSCAGVTFDAVGGPTWVSAGDFDKDGRPDLAFSFLDGLDVVLNQTP